MSDVVKLHALHASLPEPRQPAWGLGANPDVAKRPHDERISAVLPLLLALPGEDTLRILDVECAQGYFALGIAHALAAHGRTCEMVGVDRNEENIRFCEALAEYHRVPARFACTALDAAFLGRHEHAGWDVVLMLGEAAVDADTKAEDLIAAVAFLRGHSRIALCEVQADPRPFVPDAGHLVDRMPAAHTFARRVAAFARLPALADQDLYACSDHLAWIGERWFAFDRVIDRAHAGVPDAFTGQRRFFLGTSAIVKAFRGDGRHGDFNRKELAAEAEALQALPREPGRYPVLLAQADDGDMLWLARECLPGQVLSERIASGDINRDAVACGLLGELAHLESRNFFHADLRCWNVLLDGKDLRLIDFGALVRTSSPLQRLALGAVLLEIANGHAGHEEPFYASVHPIDAYPPEWQLLLHYLLDTPQSAFRYAEALRILVSSLDGTAKRDAKAGAGPSWAGELLASATQEHCEAFRRLREHDEAMERALAAVEHVHAAGLGEVSNLRARVHELERARQLAEQEHVHYAGALKGELEKSQTYAASLEARLEREADDARIEREAMEAAQRAATSYSDSLRQALDKSREYVDSLRDALTQSQSYASSLEVRIQRESADAGIEREALQAENTRLQLALAAAREEQAQMQQRFRVLKFLWPRGTAHPKEPE